MLADGHDMDPLIVTVAGIGAELSPEQQPALPVSAEEIAEDAAQCREAGASIYHLHVRDRHGAPTMHVDRFREAHDAIRARTDLIVQFTTGGAVGDSENARIGPLELRPEMATLTAGSVNFGSEVFMNPATLVSRFYKRMLELGVLPEFEIFEPGMIANAELAYRRNRGHHHRHYDFVLGVPGGMPAWDDAVDYLAAHLPEQATWSATGIGRSHLPVALRSIELGGHVRTGFEDVHFLERGRPATSNRELVELVVSRARDGGREAATPDTARGILGLEPRRGNLQG